MENIISKQTHPTILCPILIPTVKTNSDIFGINAKREEIENAFLSDSKIIWNSRAGFSAKIRLNNEDHVLKLVSVRCQDMTDEMLNEMEIYNYLKYGKFKIKMTDH